MGRFTALFTGLFIIIVLITIYSESSDGGVYNGKIYVHMMPWFETKVISGNNLWGIHWTMANQNPDIVDSTGKRQIASHFYPDIGPYASGDPNIIEYQLLLMKYSGISGVLVDWPGTLNVFDYQKNLKNAEDILTATQKFGLQCGIVYEDHNIELAANDGNIPVSGEIKAAQNDLIYAQTNYFTKSNYIKVNGAPLLLDFGPQTFTTPSNWTQIFATISPKPTFLTLWYQSQQAQGTASGEYPWIYTDFLTGLRNFYKNRQLTVKFGVAYPGFNTFYSTGGWPGPTWTLLYPGTFNQTLQLAINANVNWIQIATWNDYGEGTMIEPTVQFGTSFLTTLQETTGIPFTVTELNLIKTLFLKRVQFANNAIKTAQLNQVSDLLIALKPTQAASILSTV